MTLLKEHLSLNFALWETEAIFNFSSWPPSGQTVKCSAKRSILPSAAPAFPPSLSRAAAGSSVRVCVCISVCVLLQSDSTLGLRFPRKKLSSLSFLPVLLPLSLSLSTVIKRAGTICPFRQLITSCSLFLFAALHRCYVNTFWVVVVGGLPVLMEFVVAVWCLLSFSSTGACFWNKKSIAVF